MHHMAVELDGVAVSHFHAACLGNAANIVAAKVKQHQMFGAFLWISEERGAVFGVLDCGFATWTCARDRPDRDFAVSRADEDFGA